MIWDRLPNETPKAYAAFCIYRDLGPDRSLEKAIRANGKEYKSAKTNWQRWMSKYEWYKRAQMFDEDFFDKQKKKREKDREALYQRQSRLAEYMQQVGEDILNTLSREEKDGHLAVKLIDIGSKIERLCNDGVTENVKQEIAGSATLKVVETVDEEDLFEKIKKYEKVARELDQEERARAKNNKDSNTETEAETKPRNKANKTTTKNANRNK